MSEFKTIWQPVPSWDNMVKDRLTSKFSIAERLPKSTRKPKELSKCEKLGICSPSDKTCSKCPNKKAIKVSKSLPLVNHFPRIYNNLGSKYSNEMRKWIIKNV